MIGRDARISAGGIDDHVTNKPNNKPQKQTKKVTGGLSESLQEFLFLMEEENLDELEISDGPFHVKLVRQSKSLPPRPHVVYESVSESAPAEEPVEDESGTPVKAPLAGVFYRSPSPSSPPFVKEGDVVTADKKLCIIEAMKVMNEITAEVPGQVAKILVENGQAVHSGQTLFVVKPLS